VFEDQTMTSAGEGKRGHLADQNMSSTFLKENSMFEDIFKRQKACFCPPLSWKILPSPE